MQVLDLNALKKYHNKIITYIKAKVAESASPSIPVGTVDFIASETAPSGWLICDGSAINRNTYANLFSIIGTKFGSGDNSSTFNLPDLRAAFIRGTGTSRGYSATFGVIQSPTTIATYANGFSTKSGTLDYINPDSYTAQSNKYTIGGDSVTSNGRLISVRPYNIALTPIIKY